MVSVAVLPHHVEKNIPPDFPICNSLIFSLTYAKHVLKESFDITYSMELEVNVVSMWSHSLYPSQDFRKWSSFKNSAIYLGNKDHDLPLATGNLRDT